MAVERNKRAPVLDLSRPAGVQIEFEVSEAAEVLMSICTIADIDNHHTFDHGAEWLQTRLESLPEELRADVFLMRLGDMKAAAHLLGIVYETPMPRTFSAFMERLEAIDPIELKLQLFGHYDTTSNHIAAEIVEQAARGDSKAINDVLKEFAEWPDKHELYRTILEMDSVDVKSRLVNLLPRWYEIVFAPSEQEWREAAERDVESKRMLLERHTPEQLVELATRGYQYTPPAAIRTLALFPSWFMRPWVILWEHKTAKIFCYPIAPAPEQARSSPAEVARIYKALGDEGRLKLLRRLNNGPMKLTAAASELGVAKSTAHHHLAILRQAGFVTIRDEDENVYSLRADRPQTNELLTAYLGAADSPGIDA